MKEKFKIVYGPATLARRDGLTSGQRFAADGARRRARRSRWAAVLVPALLVLACDSGAPRSAADVAPKGALPGVPQGSLLIVGGGPIPDSILERFVALAGGAGRARIVIFPMASESADAGEELAQDFIKLGASAERQVLTREQADTDAVAASLANVTGIWFGGGDQSRLTAALRDTKAEAAMAARYRAGAGGGGPAAGAPGLPAPR